jgi:hypothetical protein
MNKILFPFLFKSLTPRSWERNGEIRMTVDSHVFAFLFENCDVIRWFSLFTIVYKNSVLCAKKNNFNFIDNGGHEKLQINLLREGRLQKRRGEEELGDFAERESSVQAETFSISQIVFGEWNSYFCKKFN